MNNAIRVTSILLALALGLFPAGFAFARDGGGDQGDGNNSLGVSLMATTSIDEGNSNSSAEATTSAETSQHQENHGRKNNEHATSTNGSRDGGRDQQEGKNYEYDSAENQTGEVEVDRESADAGMLATSTPRVEHSQDVNNSDQLRSFAAHVINEDRHVSRVALSSSTVEAHVDTPASFLGFLPTSVQAQVSVNSDGSVDVHYPWYAFFFKTNQDQVKTQVTDAVDQALASTTLDTQTQTTLSAKLQATILESITSSLKNLFR